VIWREAQCNYRHSNGTCRTLAAPVGWVFSTSSLAPTHTITRRMSKRNDFDQFFMDHHASLVRSLTAITGDSELAADSVQDAFQRAYLRWGRISRYDNPVTWVRRVAINRSRDLIRSDQRRRRNENRAAPDEAVVDPESESHLIPLLRRLPERQRIAMVLYYMEGLSVEQVADQMSLSQGAVKYHLHEGRERLRPLLENQENS